MSGWGAEQLPSLLLLCLTRGSSSSSRLGPSTEVFGHETEWLGLFSPHFACTSTAAARWLYFLSDFSSLDAMHDGIFKFLHVCNELELGVMRCTGPLLFGPRMRLSFLLAAFCLLIKCHSSVVRLDGTEPAAQFIAALQGLRNSTTANLTILIPPGVVVNLTGIHISEAGQGTVEAGLIRIAGESAEQLSVLDLGFLSDVTVCTEEPWW